jgi:uncharacterized protein YpuA (DUF1002 family)
MLTDDDIKKLITQMKQEFPTLETHAHLERTVDEIADRVNALPTKDDVQAMIDHTYSMAVLKAEHDRMKEIIRDKLHVEI